MFFGIGGWITLLIYIAFIAVLAVALYFVVRLAVFHALKSHTRWIDDGKP